MQGFFDHMDHDWLRKMLRVRIDDRAFLGLIRTWLKAGMLERDGRVIHPDTGVPQGGVVSPVLANVYWHDALDLWVEKVVKLHCRGEAVISRYADDGAPFGSAAMRHGCTRCSRSDWGHSKEPDAGNLHVRVCAGGAG